MVKKQIKRYLPDHQKLKGHRHLQWFGESLHDPNLWHLNRRSVPGAFAVGLFVAFVPIPGQMLLAGALAIYLRINLPLAVALVWITNPITMPPMFYFVYLVGSWALGHPAERIEFQPSLEWVLQELAQHWQPFFLGCFITGTVAAILGYVTMRLLWRWHAVSAWRKRRQRPAKDKSKSTVRPPEP